MGININKNQMLKDLKEFESFNKYYLKNFPQNSEQIATQERVIEYIKYAIEGKGEEWE
ncbi:MAG: hypothetical protein ACRCYT_03450 [Cetobacterium sp.]